MPAARRTRSDARQTEDRNTSTEITMMTPADIAAHNATCAELTAGDGIPRLTWEQHRLAFAGPVLEYAEGAQVAAWDSATPGTVVAVHANAYDVTFPDITDCGPCRYSRGAECQLRPWPLDVSPAQLAVRP